MSAKRVLGIWAILSILWAALYVALYALVPQDIPFVKVVSDILTPITALLLIGGAVSKILQGFRKHSIDASSTAGSH